MSLVSSAGLDFARTVRERDAQLVRGPVRTLQLNVGRLCNMACRHCHVDAGPGRAERLERPVAERVALLLGRSPGAELLDVTGGAPELNPCFRWLVREGRRLGKRVMDRCNLTVLFEPGANGVAEFLAEHAVEIVASLPWYGAECVDRQRGPGAFARSIEGLRLLNGLGYGRAGSGLELTLVHNPVHPGLPPPQAALEAAYRDELGQRFGVEFNRLYTLTNMPVRRFAHGLEASAELDAYMHLLATHFNASTLPELMCRSLVSVSHAGALHDCDFNQALSLPAGAGPPTIWDIDSLAELEGAPIATGAHCFGCTAGAGSSCSGALR